MKRPLIIIIKAIGTILGLLPVALMIIIGVLVYLNSTNRITGIARDFMNNHIAGEMYFEDLNLNFSDFPVVRVKANNGYLISHLNKYPTDTLARFRKLDASMDISYLLADSLTVYIPRAEVTDGFALVTIGKNHVPGWNIWRFKKQKPKSTRKHGHREKLYINEVHLHGHNHFVYYNARRNRSMNISADDVNMFGSIRIKYKQIYIDSFTANNVDASFNLSGGNSKIAFQSPSVTISSSNKNKDLRYYAIKAETSNTLVDLSGMKVFDGKDNVSLNIKVGADINNRIFDIQRSNIFLNDIISLAARGKVEIKKHIIDLNAQIITDDAYRVAVRYGKFINFDHKKYDFSLPLKINLVANGYFDLKKKIFPIVACRATSDNGILKTKYGAINNIVFAVNTDFDYANPDAGTLNIDTLSMKYRNSSITLNGKLMMRDKHPYLSSTVSARVDLVDMRRIVSLPLELTGKLSANAYVELPLIAAGIMKNAKIKFNNEIAVKNVKLNIPHTRAVVEAPDAYIMATPLGSLDSLRVGVRIPKVSVNSMNDVTIKARGFDLGVNVSSYSNKLFPNFSKGELKIDHASLVTSKNDIVVLKRFMGQFNLSDRNHSNPKVDYLAILQGVSYYNPDSACVFINDLSVISEAKMYSWVDINSTTIYKLWDIIGNWEYRGIMQLNNAHFTMQQLPLLNRLDSLEVVFTQNDATVERLKASFGDTHISASGDVKNWHDYIFNNSTLWVRGKAAANKINMNQLLPAVIKGVAYNQSLKKHAEKKIDVSTKFAAVPTNLDVKIDVSAHNANYGIGHLDSAVASVSVLPDSLSIKDVKFRSNIADIDLDFNYTTKQSNKAKAELNFDMKNLNVGQIIQIIPNIPRSISTFNGIFDAKLNAKWDIDSTMNIVKPSINSDAILIGKNLSVEKNKVLPHWIGNFLFGKTKTLKIDSLRFDAKMSNNIVILNPTEIKLDRYKIGTSGIIRGQQMYYHFALLRSPLGLRFGVNFYGNPSKMRLRLGSVKGKTNEKMLAALDKYPYIPIDGISAKLSLFSQKENKDHITINFPFVYETVQNLIYNNTPFTDTHLQRIQESLKLQLIRHNALPQRHNK